MLGDDRVEYVGVEVCAVVPGDGADFWVDLELGEVVGGLEGGEDAGEFDDLGEVDSAFYAVFKTQVNLVGVYCLGADDVFEHGVTPRVRSIESTDFRHGKGLLTVYLCRYPLHE